MTLLWRICFSALLCAALQAATVKGRVQLENSRESSVTKRRDYSGVVLWLAPAEGRESALTPRASTARMVQKNKTFSPHILAVEVGASVAFPNYDPIFHNAFSSYDGRVFDLGLYPPGTTRSVKFDRPGIVRVFCNIHSSMSAVIVVVDGPWFATTTAGGAFEIAGVPDGEFTIHVFHERAAPETLRALDRRLTVRGREVDLGLVHISEAGYLPLPHKNKYGTDYDPESEHNHAYPAPRK
jgi:plastocyanin